MPRRSFNTVAVHAEDLRTGDYIIVDPVPSTRPTEHFAVPAIAPIRSVDCVRDNDDIDAEESVVVTVLSMCSGIKRHTFGLRALVLILEHKE